MEMEDYLNANDSDLESLKNFSSEKIKTAQNTTSRSTINIQRSKLKFDRFKQFSSTHFLLLSRSIIPSFLC